MYVDPGAAELYLWVHIIFLGIVFFMWLYDLPDDNPKSNNRKPNGDDFTKPSDEDDGWPDW